MTITTSTTGPISKFKRDHDAPDQEISACQTETEHETEPTAGGFGPWEAMVLEHLPNPKKPAIYCSKLAFLLWFAIQYAMHVSHNSVSFLVIMAKVAWLMCKLVFLLSLLALLDLLASSRETTMYRSKKSQPVSAYGTETEHKTEPTARGSGPWEAMVLKRLLNPKNTLTSQNKFSRSTMVWDTISNVNVS